MENAIRPPRAHFHLLFRLKSNLGLSWRHLGGILGHLGKIFGPSWAPKTPPRCAKMTQKDSGFRTPYSGLPIETRPLQEIIINNHKPKSFSSSVEHPHKDSAWFTKSENNQCKASPQHSVTLLLDNFPQGAVAEIAALLRCGYLWS